MSLAYISQQLTIYVGCILFAIGIVGNCMSIFIFSSIKNYRKTSCIFYFLIGSIHNILYILINLLIRIVNTIYSIDLTRNSLSGCKIQAYLIGYLGLTSFTCSCLTTLDQFLATSRNAYLRQFSTIKFAHRFVLITMMIWCLHGIPVLMYYEYLPVTGKCGSDNPTYSSYVSVYVLIFQCIIPVFVMSLFGCLTYRNIRLTRALTEQHADSQFVRMIMIQTALVVISMGPIGCFFAYGFITSSMSKDFNRIQNESFAKTVFILISYFYYVGNFYMFLISSSRFRRTVKDRLLWMKRQNRVVALDQPAF